ncbi:MAG: AlpA family phage regulatory protein [Proteobacteria bacterium]|nr:AlpA family phage regulatory protein [Pseudomonadota bacterium]
MERILRLKAVLENTGKTRSPLYADIQAGLFVKPIKLGIRTAGWPESEVSQLIRARIEGATQEALKALVETLHRARTQPGPTNRPREN